MTVSDLSEDSKNHAEMREEQESKSDQITFYQGLLSLLGTDIFKGNGITYSEKIEANHVRVIDIQFSDKPNSQLRFKLGHAAFSLEVLPDYRRAGQRYDRQNLDALGSSFLLTEMADSKTKVHYEYRKSSYGKDFPQDTLREVGKFLVECLINKGVLRKDPPKPRRYGFELG